LSKKLHIIAPYPRGCAPSQRFRFEQYLTYFENSGYTIHFHSFINEKTWQILYKEKHYFQKAFGLFTGFLRRWFLLFRLIPAKHLFIHREMAHIGPPIFEFILAKVLRKKYIYDFDDAIWLPNFSESNAKFQRLKYYKKVHACMKWAHKVTVGNAYLYHYALQYNSNVEIIPTTIDMEKYHVGQIDYKNNDLTIGWTGSHTTIHYLEELIPALKKLQAEFAFTFLVIANEPPLFAIPNMKFVKWAKESEIEDLLKIDIGVMPLKDDQWAKGKCGFKALQYMSLGIPTIASAVGVNSEIIQHQANGLLVPPNGDWFPALHQLMHESSIRASLGRAGKRRILSAYSVQANKKKYLRLF
jgi:glycosyltransferase involved in cell wall biosynthesis